MSPSSVSTTASRSFSRYSAATSAICPDRARLSFLRASGLEYAHMCRTSTMPVSSCSTRWGCARQRTGPRAASEAVRAFGRSRPVHGRACSRKRGAQARASPSRQARLVPTSAPITPDTVTSIPSTTRAAVRSSPWKLGSPGMSIRLSFRSARSRASPTSRSRPAACARPRPRPRSSCRPRRCRAGSPRPTGRGAPRRERRLPRPAVADDGDVADLGGLGHGLSLLLGVGFRLERGHPTELFARCNPAPRQELPSAAAIACARRQVRSRQSRPTGAHGEGGRASAASGS